jgi:hypothetical protein
MFAWNEDLRAFTNYGAPESVEPVFELAHDFFMPFQVAGGAGEGESSHRTGSPRLITTIHAAVASESFQLFPTTKESHVQLGAN